MLGHPFGGRSSPVSRLSRSEADPSHSVRSSHHRQDRGGDLVGPDHRRLSGVRRLDVDPEGVSAGASIERREHAGTAMRGISSSVTSDSSRRTSVTSIISTKDRRPRLLPCLVHRPIGSAVLVGDPLELHEDEPVQQVTAEGAEVDPGQQQRSPERRDDDVTIGVEAPTRELSPITARQRALDSQ